MSCHASLLGALLLLVPFAMAKQDVPQWTEKWRVEAKQSDGGCILPAVVISDGMVYAATAPTDITAYTLDGTLKWNVTLDTMDCTVSVGPDGTVYTTAYRRSIIAFSPEGKRKWTATDPNFDTIVGYTWNEKGDTMFVTGRTGYITALTDGKRVWSKFIEDLGRPVFYQGLVYVTNTSSVFTLTPDGDVKWTYTLTGRGSKFENELCTPGPNGTVYATVEEFDGVSQVLHLYQLSAEGSFNWDFNLGKQLPVFGDTNSAGAPSTSLDGSLVYVPVYNKSPGKKQFDKKQSGPDYLPMITEGVVAVTAEGAIKWRQPAFSSFVGPKQAPVTGPDGFVYVTDSGTVFSALTPEGGKEVWSLRDFADAIYYPSFSKDGNTMVYSLFLPGSIVVLQSPATQ